MTFAGAIFLIVAGVVGLIFAIWQAAVWSRRDRVTRYDEPRY